LGVARDYFGRIFSLIEKYGKQRIDKDFD